MPQNTFVSSLKDLSTQMPVHVVHWIWDALLNIESILLKLTLLKFEYLKIKLRSWCQAIPRPPNRLFHSIQSSLRYEEEGHVCYE